MTCVTQKEASGRQNSLPEGPQEASSKQDATDTGHEPAAITRAVAFGRSRHFSHLPNRRTAPSYKSSALRIPFRLILTCY